MMAISYFNGALIAFLIFIVYNQTRNWLRWRALQKWGEAFGCAETKSVPNYLPGGIERFARFLWPVKGADVLEDLILARFKDMGANTYRFFNPFNSTMVFTAEPANIQALLATSFHDFDLGPTRRDNFFDMFGNGIFTAEGESWAHYRRQLKPQFSRGQVSDLESTERHLQILFRALPEEDAEGWIQNVDLMPLFYHFTMDVSTEFLFGRSIDSQSRALHSLESSNSTDAQADMDFAAATEFGQSYLAWRFRLNRLFWLANSAEFQKACKTVKAFADAFVAKALAKGAKRDEKKYVLLDELVKETSDPVELRDQVLHLLLAGRDTTSALLSWTILLLARHPAEFHSLRSAIIEAFGTSSAPKQELTFESLKACKPLSNVLFETLRLYPVVPFNARTAQRDTVLPLGGGPDGKRPMVVMKGEQVAFISYVLHRREDLWGSDSASWRPERFSRRKLDWSFVGFSGGARVCLGQQYALTEAGFVVAKILQRYDRIEALDMKGKLTNNLTITLKPGNGVKIRMHRASD